MGLFEMILGWEFPKPCFFYEGNSEVSLSDFKVLSDSSKYSWNVLVVDVAAAQDFLSILDPVSTSTIVLLTRTDWSDVQPRCGTKLESLKSTVALFRQGPKS